MRGAVAAGHPLTAQAGADVLAAGGNAVDAAVGAALVSWVAESPLTGPGSGGFMLVHRARDRSTRVFDFFVSVPGLGRIDSSAKASFLLVQKLMAQVATSLDPWGRRGSNRRGGSDGRGLSLRRKEKRARCPRRETYWSGGSAVKTC